MTFEVLLKKKEIYVIMLALALWFGCVPSPSLALPIDSYEQKASYGNDREIVDSFLARELVSQKLSKMGLSREEIDTRVNKLSDEQLHTLAMRLERIQSGSTGWAVALGIVLLFIGSILFFLTHNIHIEPKESQVD